MTTFSNAASFTSSASRLGRKKLTGLDDRELMLIEFGEMVLEAHREVQDFADFGISKFVKGAKADSFPVIGRKRDAAEHVAGELIVGGNVEHNEVTISVDNPMYDSVFIPEIDELLLHYSVREAYARQLGESLGSVASKRSAQTLVLASRDANGLDAIGHPVPIRIGSATMLTDAAKMESAQYRAKQYILENDLGGGSARTWLKHAQYLLLARYANIDNVDTSGSGDRSEGTVGMIAGLPSKGTNFIPAGNINTGPAKYQGDFSATVGVTASPNAIGRLVAKRPSVWMKEQGDRLGTIMIASEVYGLGSLRPEMAIEWTTLVVGTNVVSID